jgi:hypothetical protein
MGNHSPLHRFATLRTNRVAGDDREVALLALALRPLSNPAFHLNLIRPSE